MANSKKTWVSVLIAVVLIAVVLGVAAIGGTMFFVYRHIRTQFVAADTASGEFARLRDRFAGQAPMIELTSDEVLDVGGDPGTRLRAIVHRDRVAPGPIQAVHVLAYDTEHRKLVRADVPRWLLELTSAHGQLRLANLDLDAFPGTGERVTLADLDSRGPGLIFNVHRLRGTELIVWTD